MTEEITLCPIHFLATQFWMNPTGQIVIDSSAIVPRSPRLRPRWRPPSRRLFRPLHVWHSLDMP